MDTTASAPIVSQRNITVVPLKPYKFKVEANLTGLSKLSLELSQATALKMNGFHAAEHLQYGCKA